MDKTTPKYMASFNINALLLQSTRLEEQRTTLPRGGPTGREVNQMSAPTVPDEDFFSMITRLQV